MIIDDEPMILELLKGALAKYAKVTITALDGRDALNKITTVPPDCIVCDINMSPMNGIDFFRELQSSGCSPELFLFFSAHADEKQIQNALSTDVKVISKPDIKTIISEIEAALDE